MKKILKKLLLGSGVLLLIFSFGCESDDLNDKDDTEDRFQFLRRDEHESVKDTSVPLKDEEVLSKFMLTENEKLFADRLAIVDVYLPRSSLVNPADPETCGR